ncbi:hypothetical protein E2C01_034099 [Portunus trituberculatus]|uniref:Uncharacterized protein n=1 Tax=Portunus trituberculatus TaxID=210409 RepID=A0A5B7F5Z2_PORTR|nr:hypothetical protein [Portunus trituberculatus]
MNEDQEIVETCIRNKCHDRQREQRWRTSDGGRQEDQNIRDSDALIQYSVLIDSQLRTRLRNKLSGLCVSGAAANTPGAEIFNLKLKFEIHLSRAWLFHARLQTRVPPSSLVRITPETSCSPSPAIFPPPPTSPPPHCSHCQATHGSQVAHTLSRGDEKSGGRGQGTRPGGGGPTWRLRRTPQPRYLWSPVGAGQRPHTRPRAAPPPHACSRRPLCTHRPSPTRPSSLQASSSSSSSSFYFLPSSPCPVAPAAHRPEEEEEEEEDEEEKEDGRIGTHSCIADSTTPWNWYDWSDPSRPKRNPER